MTPFFGAEDSENITIENITVNGNALYQSKIPGWNGHSGSEPSKQWGQGFGNIFGFTDCDGITIQKTKLLNSLGDGSRITNTKNIKFSGNKIYGIGHDGFYADGCQHVEAWDNIIYTRINSGLRWRGGSDISFHGNKIYSTADYHPAECPGLQGETIPGQKSFDIRIYENLICDTEGPGMWISNFSGTGEDLDIHNNLVLRCGKMPAGQSNVKDTGGIYVAGWSGKIRNNTADACLGTSIGIRDYIGTSVSGCSIDLFGNIVTNTKPSNYTQTAIGIINLMKCSVTSEKNCLFGNKSNYLNIASKNDILADPCFSDEWCHLSASSPCVLPGGNLGRYAGTTEETLRVRPKVIIEQADEAVMKVFCQELLADGRIHSFSELKFLDVSKDFEV
jgi:hypothetical protein